MGIPIKEIKKLVGKYSTVSYRQQLELSLLQIEEQQKKLDMQKKVVSNALKLLEEEKNNIRLSHFKKRYIKELTVQSYEEEKSPLEMYELLKSEEIKNIMYRDLVYELREDAMLITIESTSKTGSYLESGDYLEYIFSYTRDDDVTEGIAKLLMEAENRNLKLEERIFLSMQAHAMLVVDCGIKAILFSRIAES